MEITVSNYGIHFKLEGLGSYVELIFLLRDTSEVDNGPEIEESNRYFETAPRWFYHYSPPQG